MAIRNALLPTLLIALLSPALPAAAQAAMKPGLWEIRQQPQQLDPQRQKQMAEAQQRMAAMPPEQRQAMEQMMASRGISLDMSGGGGGGMAVKICISPEQAARNQPPMLDKGKCQHDSQRSGNTINTRFRCTDPAAEGDSEVTLRANGEGFSSRTRITHQRGGKAETTQVSGDARWLGADCGGLKPQPR
ncbi:DUF3617 domain-containing protein [Roseateles sp. DAIF2]|uniref:DUF3617 domain-containing protein n=1 Tax=Roseateles sp. DAIF2 TaxID=2714952 RepID=UPI0018A2A16F|nr:DUF3617 domain-containing protein [Roseateles sp. DAIF2]QPF73537.1 DUF3617 domain-containing protein [Roseateles sp. DAIF2]